MKQCQYARDSIPIFVKGTLPVYCKPHRFVTPEKAALVAPKLDNVRQRGYIRKGVVESLTDWFEVPKVIVDDVVMEIRMVYNGTSSGLNEALWAPNFWLPTSSTALRQLTYTSFCVDLDLGEMFLNFPLDPKIQPYAGVDLTPVKHLLSDIDDIDTSSKKERNLPLWERWCRLFMGMTPSPYNAARHYYWAEEVARGDPRTFDNPMRYDEVKLNIPGSKFYNPALPWIYKWNKLVMKIAGDLATYVDDLRVAGYDIDNTWLVARRVASRFQYLGIQDAPRKRRCSTQTSGAWGGGIFSITPEKITKTVSQEKWTKGRLMVRDLFEMVSKNRSAILGHKSLEKRRGFLVHLSMTFSNIVPFLKGIHLTLDSWRPKRNTNGWKMTNREWSEYIHKSLREGQDMDYLSELLEKEAPSSVTAVPRLFNDLKALWAIFERETPPEITVRVSKMLTVVYAFGDASGRGFGASLGRDNGISYRIGVWSSKEEIESSNRKEFTNVIETLEDEGEKGNLNGTEVFFFTDNSTVEFALYNGTSSSEKLLTLVVRFKALETNYSVRIHVCHCAGTRMIAQGTDGISRGALNEGVMTGEQMTNYVPLHLNAIERHNPLREWLTSIVGTSIEFLEPIDWFQKGHDVRGWMKPQTGSILEGLES